MGAAGTAAAAAEMDRDDEFSTIGEETMGGDDDLQLDDVGDLGGDLDDDI